ncbi:MAG: DUF4065 domain-containing protein [Anaerolineaceae bacterium]|nr:DUF4065 domain-containing protein [Anaerolineae bacterium]MCB9460213.1 DUF4065 domain-containing protein [Anaerolineaceae bacterium]
MYTKLNTSARKIADYLIAKARQENTDISPLKLQKLLYYVQGHGLGILDRPVFPEDIEAWKQGPVVQSVYDAFKDHRMHDNLSEAIDIESVEFDIETQWIIDEVWRNYGKANDSELSQMTHEESPWKNAFYASPSQNAVIKHRALREHFKEQERQVVIRYENFPRPRNRFSVSDLDKLLKLPVGEREALIRDYEREADLYAKQHGIDLATELSAPYEDD